MDGTVGTAPAIFQDGQVGDASRATSSARRPAPRADSPLSPEFRATVLTQLAQRAQLGEDRVVLADELFEQLQPWLRGVIANLCRSSTATVRNDDLESQVMLAAFTACRACDWENALAWPALLRTKVATARAEVTRASAWASRRHARIRNAWQKSIDELTQELGRTPTPMEQLEALQKVAPPSSRTNWASEVLQLQAEPMSVDAFTEDVMPASPTEPSTAVTDADERLRIENWLRQQLPAPLAEQLTAWLSDAMDHDRPLPRALRSKLQPYLPSLLGLLDLG